LREIILLLSSLSEKHASFIGGIREFSRIFSGFALICSFQKVKSRSRFSFGETVNAGEHMKLWTFAERVGVRYETAWRWFKAGKIKGRQLDTGTIIVTEDFDEPVEVDVIVVVYARVSANENRPNLDTQAERLCVYCAAKGWKVHKVVKEVGSGINDGRKKLLALLADPTVKIIVVEHKDRLTRFGFKYIETLLAVQGRSIEVVNLAENPLEDLIADLVSIIYSFSSRLYGQRRAKRKTEQIVKELELQAQEKGGEKDAAS
jgi:putative resolvase